MYLIHREDSQRNLQQLANSMPPCSPGDDGVNDENCVSCEEEMAVGGVEVGQQQQQQQRLLLPVDAPVFVPGAPVAAIRAADDGDDGDGDGGDGGNDDDDDGGGDGCSAAAAAGGGGDDGRSAKVEASDMSR